MSPISSKLLKAVSLLALPACHRGKKPHLGPREEYSPGSGSRLQVESFQMPHDTAWPTATAMAKPK